MPRPSSSVQISHFIKFLDSVSVSEDARVTGPVGFERRLKDGVHVIVFQRRQIKMERHQIFDGLQIGDLMNLGGLDAQDRTWFEVL